jgi:desulfoferrodoxin-like iron-binding protein
MDVSTANEAPILAGLHSVDNIDTADDFSKKHVPYVSAMRDGDKVAIEVEVGHYVAHPNIPEHWIDLVEVSANGATIAVQNFGPGVAWPKMTCLATLAPGTKVTVSARCNIHGVWVSETDV